MLASLDHVAVTVADLSAATALYTDLLGREPCWRGCVAGTETAGAVFRLANTAIELWAPAREGEAPSQLAVRLRADGEGVCELAFEVDDVKAATEALRARGLNADEPCDLELAPEDGEAVRALRSATLTQVSTRGIPIRLLELLDGEPPGPSPPAPDVDPAGIATGLDHVVIASADLDASAKLYGEALGLRLALDRGFPKRGVRLLFFRLAGVTIELSGRLGEAPRAPAPDRFYGLAYQVRDADAARERVLHAGFEVSELRPGNKPGTRVCTVRSETRGVPTLLIEPSG